MKLATIYKKTSKGAIEQWSIWTEGADIVTEYGHVGGKMQQSRERAEAMNVGKANMRSAVAQAEAQAKSQHLAKTERKGYVDSIEKAQAGENGGAGGIRPMLAKPFEDCEKKFVYPCYAQPKLDGIRCIAVVEDNSSVSLWSREQKPIVAVPRIVEAVQALNLPPGTVLDGELYNHELKDDFETISSCVRKQYAASDEEQALIQYHVYDLPRHPGLPANAHFGDRTTLLALILGNAMSSIHFVETKLIDMRPRLLSYRRDCQLRGYEGAMARALEPYQEGKRSSFLLKLKEFLEDDYAIVGVREGVGKMAGLAIFECRREAVPESDDERMKVAANFSVKLEGKLENLKQYLVDESTWQGKKLTVKYFALTNKNKVPRFPVGKCVRDYE